MIKTKIMAIPLRKLLALGEKINSFDTLLIYLLFKLNANDF